MERDWRPVTLRQAGVALIDCDHSTPPAASDGYPYVTIPQIKNGRLDLSGARKISHEHFEKWTRKALPQPFDVVLSRRCNPGETAFVPPELKFALGQNLVLLRADGEKVFPPFLRWWARGPEWWRQIERFLNMGAVFESLKCADIPNFELSLPPLDEQRAIARVLGALDDKIELNRRMNRTLEELATTLFRSWFVDFDPVVAKAAGRKPVHLRPEVAALFPAHFQDSEVGPIPHGWETHSVEDLAQYVNGRAFTKGASGKGRMVIRIAELNSGPGGSTIYSDIDVAPEHVAQPGDLLFAWSGSLDVYRWYRDEAIINQHIFKVICQKYPQWFVHQQLREAMPFFQDVAADKATTMGHIKREHLSQALLAVPPKELFDAADKIYQPLYNKQLANERESLTLAALCDTLLPKLLSGELRTNAAEKLINNNA
jgi:type I restriction enzyme S subunit